MTGQNLVDIAETRKGDAYILGSLAPKNDADYHGPWDCAEMVSWATYQVIQKLYGCANDNSDDPAHADAGTVYWGRDCDQNLFKLISQEEAKATPGAILLREAGGGLDGHIVISKGDGKTIEAMGRAWGVTEGVVDGRRWTHGILLNEVEYTPNETTEVSPVEVVYMGSNSSVEEVTTIQNALESKGFPVEGGSDGIFGVNTANAVKEFQNHIGLTPDGEVGPQTKSALGL